MKGKRKNSSENSHFKDINLPALMRNLPGMVYRCKNDPDWTMEFVSEGCFELTGYHSEALINNTYVSYGELIHFDDRDLVWEAVKKSIENKDAFKITYRITTRDGNEKWVYEQGQGIFNEDQELLAIEGFMTDITEQKKAEIALEQSLSEKKLLLSEIHHRVKNNMQIIISMLSLQMSTNPECEQVIESVIERIRVFSDMHQQLYRFKDRELVDLGEQVNEIFRNLLHAYNFTEESIKLEVNFPQPFFRFDSAISLGLIFNEIISNSLKHAFDTGEGWIKIDMHMDEAGEIGLIEYSDSGIDIGSTEGGFGTLLLEAMAFQLNLKTEIVVRGNLKYIFRK